MKQIKFRLVDRWGNLSLYTASNGVKTVPFTASLAVDKIGRLYKVECSQLNDFEKYGMASVKAVVSQLFN